MKRVIAAIVGLVVASAPGRAWTATELNAASGAATVPGDARARAQQAPRRSADPVDEVRQGRDALAVGDRQPAAEHLQQAAALLRKAATRAPSDVKAALLDAALDLDQHARFVMSGALTSAGQLDQVRGRVQYALAQYHHWRALDSWARRSAAETGRELRRAADLVEGVTVWTGHRLDVAAATAVHQARAVADTLVARAHRATEEVDAAIAAVAQQIRALGRDIGRRS
jgi:hypothetical protein